MKSSDGKYYPTCRIGLVGANNGKNQLIFGTQFRQNDTQSLFFNRICAYIKLSGYNNRKVFPKKYETLALKTEYIC